MVTLDVRFTCEICHKEIIHKLRIGPNFFLGADSIPEDWYLEVSEHFMKAWCPQHASSKK